MRLTAAAFLLSVLAVVGAGGPGAAQPKDDKKDPVPQNELLTAFSDNPERFKGKELTFLLTYKTTSVLTLRGRRGQDGVSFEGKSPSGKAKVTLGLWVTLPAKDIPNADDGDDVIVTFVCAAGSTTKGNKTTRIRRPE